MKLNSQNPIGFFDSGIGGTSIWKEVNLLLPNESTIYLSDSKNSPYGTKTKDEIIELSVKNTEFLLNKNAKLIVVACNTATTNAITHLRNTYDIPFIGIEPAIKPASLKTQNKTIGILATKGTLNSKLFAETSSLFKSEFKIIEQVGEGLVELIEGGKINSKEMEEVLKNHLNNIISKNADCLVLGCTHYHYLIPKIKEIIGNKIQIIDSGEAVAKQTKNILLKNNIINNCIESEKTYQFYTNSSKTVLENILPKKDTIKIDEINF